MVKNPNFNSALRGPSERFPKHFPDWAHWLFEVWNKVSSVSENLALQEHLNGK